MNGGSHESRWLPQDTQPAPPGPPRPAPQHPGGGAPRRTVTLPAWAAWAGGLLLLAAVAAIVVLAATRGNDAKRSPATATAPTATAPTTSTQQAAASLLRGLRDPFVTDGVRWAVFTAPHQSWTVFADKTPAGGGRRWLLVSVRLRNLSRTDLDPLVLPYRLEDDAGHVYRPDPRYGTGPQAKRTGQRLGRNKLEQTELAFRVPNDATQLRLSFRTGASAGAGKLVVVPLGAS